MMLARNARSLVLSNLFAEDRGFWLSQAWQGAFAAPTMTDARLTDSSSDFVMSSKMLTAFPIDGIGKVSVPNAAVTIVTSDEAGDGIGAAPGNPTITVGAAAHTIGTINTIGDQDFYAIHLDAGTLYQIGLYGYVGGPNAAPLPDAYIELYDSSGHLIDVADGGGETPGGQAEGLDAMLTVKVATSGTYYINARAFDQNDANGENGDGVGDYELFARVSSYTPYYDTNSPLYSIDWGTQVNKIHQSVRNPDNDEGPRNTGNPQGTLNYSDITSLQALATAQGKDITGKNVITVYFAHAGEVYIDDDPTTPGTTETNVAKGFQPWEIAAYKYAFAAYEKVADIVYLVVDGPNVYNPVTHTAAADFTFLTYAGTPGTAGTPSLLGRMSPPDTDNEGQSEFNGNDIRWTQEGLAPGGFSFTTLIHEMGHGHGLAHPHDNGGHSGVMHGVQASGTASVASYTNGDFDLNQSVYTMMSYEDGWEKSPYGQADSTDPNGWLKGLMAFDIAAIQDKYGVNEGTARGDNVYVLEDTNHGTVFDANNNIVQYASGFESIWDAAGTDEISYSGARDVNIDLRPASLQYAYGGGGWISYAWGIYGGYTIASGVTIENATSDAGNDTLRGNSVGNRINSGAGNDIIYLQDGGDDTVNAGAGNDGIYFGAALTVGDSVEGGGGNDQLIIQGDYTAASALTLGNVTNVGVMILLPGNDTRFGDAGTNLYSYDITTANVNVAPGALMYIDANRLRPGENLTFNGSAETDGGFFVYAGKGVDTLTGGAQADAFLFRGPGNLTAADAINGGGGQDELLLRGDYTGANAIVFSATTITSIEAIVVVSGHDLRYGKEAGPYSFDLTTDNANVASGQTMIVDAGTLRANETLTFNGSAETDGGKFRMFGGQGADVLTGGSGADSFRGGLGGDTLTGGGGADTFAYRNAGESSSTHFDTLVGFNYAEDKIDLPVGVAGWSGTASVSSGGLSNASFDTDLASAIDGALDPSKALLFTPDSGDYAGKTFLIVDGDGDGSYTADHDYVIMLQSPAAPISTGGTPDFLV